ncbi:MAG: GNAT family N-acetyltransferase [Chitinophagaceae bacterium]|nr:GNAT family N-acetyltransferase [Chitinophagaceae bacterium]
MSRLPIQLNFPAFPELETANLYLRRITEAHVADLFEMRSNPEVMRFIPRPLAKEHQDVRNLIAMIDEGYEAHERINWGMIDKETGKLIGTIGFVRNKPEDFRGEIGYMLHPDFRGRGLMHEAMEKVLQFGFEHIRYHSIEGVVDPENKSSVMVLERSGFVREAHFREHQYYEGRFLSSYYYSLIHPGERQGLDMGHD